MKTIDDLIEQTLLIQSLLDSEEWEEATKRIAIRDEVARALFVDQYIEDMSQEDVKKYRLLVEKNNDIVNQMNEERLLVENKLSEFNKSKKAEKIYKNI